MGSQDRRQAQGPDSAAAIRGGNSSRDRNEGDCAYHSETTAQGCSRQVLWWRHHAQAETPREAEGGEKAHETGWLGRNSAGGFSRGAAGRLGERIARYPDEIGRAHV